MLIVNCLCGERLSSEMVYDDLIAAANIWSLPHCFCRSILWQTVSLRHIQLPLKAVHVVSTDAL